jgi:hypothetical protein
MKTILATILLVLSAQAAMAGISVKEQTLAFERQCQSKNIQNYQEYLQFVEENINTAPPEMVRGYADMQAYNSSKLLLLEMMGLANKSDVEKNAVSSRIDKDLNSNAQAQIRLFCYGQTQ